MKHFTRELLRILRIDSDHVVENKIRIPTNFKEQQKGNTKLDSRTLLYNETVILIHKNVLKISFLNQTEPIQQNKRVILQNRNFNKTSFRSVTLYLNFKHVIINPYNLNNYKNTQINSCNTVKKHKRSVKITKQTVKKTKISSTLHVASQS